MSLDYKRKMARSLKNEIKELEQDMEIDSWKYPAMADVRAETSAIIERYAVNSKII